MISSVSQFFPNASIRSNKFSFLLRKIGKAGLVEWIEHPGFDALGSRGLILPRYLQIPLLYSDAMRLPIR